MVNVKDVVYGKTHRKSYAKIDELTEMPNLIQVQKDSFNWFCTEGLKEVFDEMAPITTIRKADLNLSTQLSTCRSIRGEWQGEGATFATMKSG